MYSLLFISNYWLLILQNFYNNRTTHKHTFRNPIKHIIIITYNQLVYFNTFGQNGLFALLQLYIYIRTTSVAKAGLVKIETVCKRFCGVFLMVVLIIM